MHNVPIGDSCQDDGEDFEKCLSPEIPSCIDTNIYCRTPPGAPQDGVRTDTNRPVVEDGYDNFNGTEIVYTCPTLNWYFDYILPDPFVSYFYSTNINNITIKCNEDGCVF